MMQKFSANLGFLFADKPLPDAIAAAGAAGFDAVELHWPYATPAEETRRALQDAGLPLLALNTAKGDGFGLSALPGEEARARAAIDQAVDYARAAGAGAIHVMAGVASGPEARAAFLAALSYADRLAEPAGLTLLIEPLNLGDAPGYYLTTMAKAASLQDALGSPRVKILFDVYHRQRVEGDLIRLYRAHAHRIGHVQIAGAPDRREPDRGEVAYPWLLRAMAAAGHEGFIGAEYKPETTTEAGLGWLAAFRAALTADG